jgi:AraC-like DNA-binding protein/mannose-6-phosphate isomerase-like protein (cupin superfamily)
MEKARKKKQIPVYDIPALQPNTSPGADVLAEKLDTYLPRHYEHLQYPHRHSFFHLVLFTAGGGWHTIDFEKFRVKAGQIYFMHPGQVHSWHFEGEVKGYVVNFSEALFQHFLVNQQYLERFRFFDGISEDQVLQLTAPLQKEAIALLEQLVALAAAPDGRNDDYLKIKLLELFFLVEQKAENKQKNAIPPVKYTLLRSFRKLLEQNFRTMRLPKEYAALLYVTPNHLNAFCQDVLGQTAGEIIRDRVLLEAKRLLTNGDMHIAGIADELHFNDYSYFNRFFKKGTGYTPEEFRHHFLKNE